MDQMDIRARQLAKARGEGKYLKAGRQAPAQTASGSGNMQAEKRKRKHAMAAASVASAAARRLFRSINLRAKYIFYLNISNGYYFKLPTRWLI